MSKEGYEEALELSRAAGHGITSYPIEKPK